MKNGKSPVSLKATLLENLYKETAVRDDAP
jgi:hypothetical protein